MSKLIFLVINLAIVATPLTAIYLYFNLKIQKIKVGKTNEKLKSEILRYEEEVNQKLFPNYDTLLKFFEKPKEEHVTQKISSLEKDFEKYQLIGISSSGEGKSMAIIKNKMTNKQILLKIGGMLEHATLTHIDFENEFIKFERGEEKYIMELTKLAEKATSPTQRADGPTSRTGQPHFGYSKTKLDKKADWENKKPVEIIKIDKDLYTENLFYTDSQSVEYVKQNLHKVANEIYLRPIFTEDASKLIGFKVEQIKNNSVFKKVGIRESDIITKINNTSLTSLQEMTKLFYSHELYARKDFEFYILRDGKEIKIQIKVND